MFFFIYFYSYFHLMLLLFFIFFFSSRRRHTRLVSNWSSDVCSSDLPSQSWKYRRRQPSALSGGNRQVPQPATVPGLLNATQPTLLDRSSARRRSEERRVGKECRSRGGADH